jgi:hypothetical protein
MLLRLVLLSSAVLSGLLVWTQMIYPALRNRPLFPFFNPQYRRATKKLEEARESQIIAEAQREHSRVQARVASLEVETHEEVDQTLDHLINR